MMGRFLIEAMNELFDRERPRSGTARISTMCIVFFYFASMCSCNLGGWGPGGGVCAETVEEERKNAKSGE